MKISLQFTISLHLLTRKLELHCFADSSSLSGSLVLLSPTSSKIPDFLWNVINTSASEVLNNKVSHLVIFILGFETENSVPLSEVFIIIK